MSSESSGDSQLDPIFVAVECRNCGVRLRVRSSLAGKSARCPKCQAAIEIPEITDYCDESEAPLPDIPTNEYRLAIPLSHEPDAAVPEPLPPELVAPRPEHGFLDQLGQVRQVARSKPPRHLFFSGVFEFPWYDSVWPRWIWLVLGGISISVIPVFALAILNGASGYSGIALAFFAMPQIWLTLWTGSYAASCGLQVFEDTAAGNDVVTGWPEPNWREWMSALMQQAYVCLMIFAVAYGIGKAAGLSGPSLFWLITGIEFVLFPFCFLSVLEANSLLVFLSPSVIRTLLTKPLSWLGFYLLAGMLMTGWGGALYLTCQYSLIAGMFLNGFLFGAGVLIYYRLLGRLAWSISRGHRKLRTVISSLPTS